MEYCYTQYLHPAALVGRKQAFGQINPAVLFNRDAGQFVRECESKGIKLYSSDRFNYASVVPGTAEVFIPNGIYTGMPEKYRTIGRTPYYREYVRV